VNRWCKHLTAVSDGRLNDAHAHSAHTTSDRTAHKNFTPVRYVEPMFQIWWRLVHK